MWLVFNILGLLALVKGVLLLLNFDASYVRVLWTTAKLTVTPGQDHLLRVWNLVRRGASISYKIIIITW